MIKLAILFCLSALIYASVGFGGGSTYTALLALAQTDYRILPLVSLACNLVVVSGGVWRFSQQGQIPWARALPLCAVSVPLAWLGGYLAVPETLFIGLLSLSLFLAGGLMLATPARKVSTASLGAAAMPACPDSGRAVTLRALTLREGAIGGGLGLLSGIVGIGGGIFLSPILHLTGWAQPRRIAGTASLFILLKSAAGMLGHLAKLEAGEVAMATAYWPLLAVVLVGGQIGSRLGVSILPEIWLRRLTAVLVIIVAIRLFFRFSSLLGGA